MKSLILVVLLCGWALYPLPGESQSSPQAFPLAGDWQGDLQIKGAVHHLVLHLDTKAEGKMTALEDFPDENSYGWPAIGGSFDGSHLTLRFAQWKLNSEGTAAYPSVYSYEATVSPSGTELTGVIKEQEESWPLNCKRVTWQVKTPKPAPPTPVDGDWAGIEDWGNNKVRKVFHISNTEDGLAQCHRALCRCDWQADARRRRHTGPCRQPTLARPRWRVALCRARPDNNGLPRL